MRRVPGITQAYQGVYYYKHKSFKSFMIVCSLLLWWVRERRSQVKRVGVRVFFIITLESLDGMEQTRALIGRPAPVVQFIVASLLSVHTECGRWPGFCLLLL